jgi:UDP-N-acetylglucosamine--N-acetylmuramyl-(pentapeptide) pyrophosphoryl-undecaprenol N-acetylglucosamine transferase
MYIGTDGIEKDRVKKTGIDFYEIRATKLRRGKLFVNIRVPFELVRAIKQAKKILKEQKPDIVVSKGGFVALPVCIAARKLKIPIVAHESDCSFGLANKIILKLCNTMCVNFKNLEEKNNKCVYTGPIFSKEFYTESKDYSNLIIDKAKLTILIVGGSLGSKFINEQVYNSLLKLKEKFNIIHITGKGNLKHKSHGNYNAMEMSDNIVNLYNIADFVIARSGAGVSAECFFKNLPMLLIPLENKSTRGDQVLNAEYYKNIGVAEIVHEKELESSTLYEKVLNFASRLHEYKQNFKNNPKTNGKQKVLDIIKKQKRTD